MELASPSYMGFGVHLIINLLPHDRLRDFVFYVELAFPGYLGFGEQLPFSRLSAYFFLIEDEILFYIFHALPTLKEAL